MPDTEQQLLAMSEEAAVLVQGGRAVFANAAAREILGDDCVGKRTGTLFGEIVSGAQASAFLAQITLNERPFLLRIGRLGEGQVIFLRSQEELPVVLNQPFLFALRSALMNAGMAADQMRALAEDESNGPILASLRSVSRSQFQLLRLLSNASLVLDLSQGQAVCRPQVFDLSEMCRSILDGVGSMIPQIRFVFRCRSGILIEADPRLIKSLLLNLLSNAVLHGKGCSRVAVSILEAPQSVVLAVDDDGCGIPREELPLVFDRYRHGFSLSQISAGPGLGLTAARLVAQLHKGALLLESRPGEGTTLRVSLQRGDAAKLRAPEEPVLCETRELLTALADCLPLDCFREQYLD